MADQTISSDETSYVVGEQVLCHEPNARRMKLLYESTILKIRPEKDEQGRDSPGYLVHFHGWKSTTDQYVSAEYLLKDNDENRTLQKTMADEAGVVAEGYVYRKVLKRKAKSNPKPVALEQDGNSVDEEESTVDRDIEPGPSGTSVLPKRNLHFPEYLKVQLVNSIHFVRCKNDLIRIPSVPNVATLFQNYLKYLARNDFGDKYIMENNKSPHELERRFNLCVEVLGIVRILFNKYLMTELLLNDNEKLQYDEAIKVILRQPVNNTQQNFEQENGKQENLHTPSTSKYAKLQKTCSDYSSRKPQCSTIAKDVSFESLRNEIISKADEWKAVPDSAYNEKIKEPVIVYGVLHLLRLLDALPQILAQIKMQCEKLSTIYLYCNKLLRYILTQTDLFGPQYYLFKDPPDE